MPDVRAVRAFLDSKHIQLAERFAAFASWRVAPRPHPASDDEARVEARALLALLGGGEWFAAIAEQDLRACALIRETLAAASPLADAVFALQALGATPLVLAGSAAQRARWLPAVGRGEAMAAFAMTEPDAGSDVAAMTTVARRDGETYVLNGTKTLISNAGIADFYVVFASTSPARGKKGITSFLVPANHPGLVFVRPQVLSSPHPLGEIALRDCRLDLSAMIGQEGDGMRLGLATLDRLRATVGAAACGMAERALDEALGLAIVRRQFGKKLAEFQLTQDKIARMATDLTAARLLVYRAAWEKDGGAERVTVESAMAKAFATETAQRIVDDAIQIVGGQGVLADHPLDLLYRSVRALRIYEGTTEMQRLIIAGQVIAQAEASV
ncbi:MAG TPA: acyl-CoA dehydrogenase family protein [Gemmatimonadales bacterium]